MTKQSDHLGIGDRQKRSPAPELIDSAFTLEASDGPLLHQAMGTADLAHAVMLIEIGVIPQTAAGRLLTALFEMNVIPPNEFPFDPSRGDAYTNREALLHQKAPQVAGWLRAGRPRREVTTLAYLLVVRERLLTLTGALLDLMQALLCLAEANLNSLLPDYTYLQTAHPTTLAHYLLTFVQPMARDLDRIQAVYTRTNLSPAGSGSTNGSRLPLDRTRLAELLGFDNLVLHTRDAMWQPDGPIEVMGTVVAILVNADRLSEDLLIWASTEFGFIELSDRFSRTSVIMPQKKNPYSLAFVRGVARDMIGRLASVAALGATPSGQVDNRIFIYGGVPNALERASQAVQLLAGTVSSLTINHETMAQRVKQGFSGATDLSDVIMLKCNLDSRTAHRIVGHAVRLAVDSDSPLTSEILDVSAQAIIKHPLGLSDDEITQAMDPEKIVYTRTGLGGASPQSVTEMIGIFQNLVTDYEAWRASCEQKIKRAEKKLQERAQELCQSI